MPKKPGKAAPKPKKRVGTPKEPRQVQPEKYKSFQLQKRIRHPVKLPNAWQLTRRTADTLWQHKRLFGAITLVYGFLNLVLVQGISSGADISELKNTINQVLDGNFGFLGTSLGTFAALVGSAGNTTSQTAAAYQMFLGVIASLAMIWALRQVLSGAHPGLRDAYYRGMYPLVPFLLVLFVISLQLIPLTVGSALYSTVINNGVAVYAAEKLIWLLVFGVLALLTLYMVSSSLFALYIVTLPDMTPLKALRTARGLVRYRRWAVIRKLLYLPVLLLVVAAMIMVPVITLLAPLAEWVFFILTMSALLAFHAYVYTLYRELLDE
ncbi:MAG TPA: hypothetical protein VD706_03430 [Candidatus Saccharimonadales bacterium]|nr:hypothetical protein [Candidatus Saccharimonadales bacterium]